MMRSNPKLILVVLCCWRSDWRTEIRWATRPAMRCKCCTSGTDLPPRGQKGLLVSIGMPEQTHGQQNSHKVSAATCAANHGDTSGARNRAGPPLIQKIQEPRITPTSPLLGQTRWTLGCITKRLSIWHLLMRAAMPSLQMALSSIARYRRKTVSAASTNKARCRNLLP